MPSKKFRATTNKFTAILVWVFAFATIAVNAFVEALSPSVVVILVLLAAAAWLMFWRPTLSIDAEGINVQNALRYVRIDFADIQAVDSRFGLLVFSDDKRYNVLAVSGRNSAIARDVFDAWQNWVSKNA